MLINEKAADKYSFPNESLQLYYINAFTGFIQETYSDNALHLWANIDRVDSYFKKNEKKDFDLDYFVKEFIFRYKERPEVKESVKVYNSGEANYKTKDAVDLERSGVTNTQKKEIFKKVREKTIQTSDQAFMNILNSAKKKWTPKEIYDEILNVIPFTELISVAAECMIKHINVNPARKVCQTVIKALKIEEIDKILRHVNTSTSQEAGRLKDYLLDQGLDISPGAPSQKDQIKIALRELSDQAVTDDDFLCAVIFASVPAALAMLSLFGSSAFDKLADELADEVAGGVDKILEETDKFVKRELINPAADILNSVEDFLSSHKFLSFTGDWKKLVADALIEIIKQTIIELIAMLIREIAYLCEGSSKADFANMAKVSDYNDINFMTDTVSPFDFSPQDFVTDDGVYDEIKDLLDGYGLDNEITSDLIEDFIAAITNILTLSEFCSLFSEDTSDFNYSVAVNKVWTGLLSLERFKIIKDTLRTKNNLSILFSILANKIDSSVCLDKLDSLENTKKILSEICEPISNSALVDDLKDKATDAAIQSLLNQEESIIDDLVDAIYKLKNPEKPVLFCGPEAERTGATPIISSFQHPSISYLDQHFLKTSLSGSVSLFESNLDSFKSIMLNLQGIAEPKDILNKINNASGKVVGTMASAYGFENENSGKIKFKSKGYDKLNKDDLNPVVEDNAQVAQSVKSSLLDLTQINIYESNAETETVRFGTSVFGDTITLKYDFKPGGQGGESVFEILNATTQQSVSYTSDLQGISWTDLKNRINTFGSNFIEQAVKDTINLNFYADLNAQIIKEHAEFITTQDLFTRTRFDRLKLTRKNLCQQSIFIIQDIIEDAKANVDIIECNYGLGSVSDRKRIRPNICSY